MLSLVSRDWWVFALRGVLGLVQAEEQPQLAKVLAELADFIAAHVDMPALRFTSDLTVAQNPAHVVFTGVTQTQNHIFQLNTLILNCAGNAAKLITPAQINAIPSTLPAGMLSPSHTTDTAATTT